MVKRECCTPMLHNYIDISSLMVYTEQIEGPKLKEITRDEKRPRSGESSKPKFKKRFINQESSWGTRICFPTKIVKEVVMIMLCLAVLVMEVTLT